MFIKQKVFFEFFSVSRVAPNQKGGPNSKAYFTKLNQYTGLEAKILLSKNTVLRENELKSRPTLVFFRDWVIKLGFMDGLEGFFFCVFSAYYDFVKLAKLWELKRKND